MKRPGTPVSHGVLALAAGCCGVALAHAAMQALPWLEPARFVLMPLLAISPALSVAFWSEARQRRRALQALEVGGLQ